MRAAFLIVNLYWVQIVKRMKRVLLDYARPRGSVLQRNAVAKSLRESVCRRFSEMLDQHTAATDDDFLRQRNPIAPLISPSQIHGVMLGRQTVGQRNRISCDSRISEPIDKGLCVRPDSLQLLTCGNLLSNVVGRSP